MHSQSLKIRRLVEEKMELQRKGKDGGGSSPGLTRSESLGSIESEEGGIHFFLSSFLTFSPSSSSLAFPLLLLLCFALSLIWIGLERSLT